MINYNSTDNSVKLIRELCPHWKIVNSRNSEFYEPLITQEVEDYEREITGWRICLNVTEFLYGNFSLLTDSSIAKEFYVPAISMVDTMEIRPDELLDKNLPLHDQFKHGRTWDKSIEENQYRILTNYPHRYPSGRHYKKVQGKDFLILKYKFCPMTEQFIRRKLQIQDRIPYTQVKLFKSGDYHTANGSGLTAEKLINNYYKRIDIVDVSAIIDPYIEMTIRNRQDSCL